MAQMMCFASFGPVHLIIASHKSLKISLIPVRWLVDIKNTNNNKKHLLMAQTTHLMSFGVVWARYRCSCLH